ncbi:T9SS type A sorting domain-containing protein [Chryseobacterium arthrosphaerae]|uniref:T9SS type A sorting domain-containing protein n=1 Tax=Chryseobacterium arthrosphaerae TaxID=651561 RepID=UPI000F4DD54B|nr:T9SS type A sorting domain-containing protein [Chryseobacterium arthrosphaerae]
MKYFCSLLLFSATLGAQVQPVIYDTIALNLGNDTIKANNTTIQNVITLSKTFRGLPKLIKIDTANNYQPVFSSDTWPPGAWSRGYFSGYIGNYKKFYEYDPDAKYSGFWSSHPQPRDTSKQIRAMIHYDNYYSNSQNSPTIIQGLEYLISQQVKNTANNLAFGGYIYWWSREGKDIFDQIDTPGNISQNSVHVFETGSAIAGLCEGYLYLKKNNIQLPGGLYDAIVNAADNLNTVDLIGYNSENYTAFGLWGLTKAYKITQNCKYLEKIIQLSNWLLDQQSNEPGICNGTWKNGVETLPNGQKVYHESKINYHAIILRGLIESLDGIPKSNVVLREKLIAGIKKGINHIIKYRVEYENASYLGTLSTFYSTIECEKIANLNNKDYYSFLYSDDIVEMFALLAYYANFNKDNFSQAENDRLKKLLNIISIHAQTRIDPDNNGVPPELTPDEKKEDQKRRAVDQMASLAYYLDYTKAIKNNTKVFEVDNTNFFDSEKTSKPVSLDFDHNGVRDEVAYFSTNGDKTFLNVAKMAPDGSISSVKNVWGSAGYPLELFSDRIVSGDFNGDGYFDDIAVMYYYGGGETRIHVFEGTGSGFIYSNEAQGWWKETGYYANLIGDRMVSGDFDNNNIHNDIAVMYDYGNGETRIHVFQGQGSNKSFKYLGADGFWKSTSYSANNIISNIVSGNFDNDGRHNDIAVFYKNSNDATAVHVFQGMGSSFVFHQWWADSGYPFNQFAKRIVSGNFYDGNKRDDIAVLYESDPEHTNLQLFQGKGDHFNYLGSTGYWASTNYDSKKIKGKLVDFNIENDDKSQIFAMYNVSNKDSKLQVFKNNMYNTPPNFALSEVKDWWKNTCYGDVNLQNQHVPSSVSRMVGKPSEKDTSDKISDIRIYKDSGSYEVVSQEKIKSIQIVDFSGKVIQEYTGIFSNRFRFDILKGNYIVKVSDINNKISTKKILD